MTVDEPHMIFAAPMQNVRLGNSLIGSGPCNCVTGATGAAKPSTAVCDESLTATEQYARRSFNP